jgi:hypothetical protein
MNFQLNSFLGSLQAGAGPDQHGPPPDRQRVEGLRASAQVRGQSLQVQAAEEGRPGQDGHHHEATESVSTVSGAGRVMEVLRAVLWIRSEAVLRIHDI